MTNAGCAHRPWTKRSRPDGTLARDGDRDAIALAGDWVVLVSDAKFRAGHAVESNQRLAALAPFVTNGSYVVIKDEFGRRRRVSFQVGCFHTKKLQSSLSDLWRHLPHRWRRGSSSQ
jgi:hypothetical protein